MRKKPTVISQADLDLFQAAMKDTKPLVKKKVRLTPPPPAIARPKATPSDKTAFYYPVHSNIEPVSADKFISFACSGISNKILRKLKKGQYNVDALLDLHGMTVEEARMAIDDCLQKSLLEGIRILLVIHGKGHCSQQPILKNKLNHWLREINVVLAFCSAAPIHGGRGAMYVLLKRTTGDDLLE